MTGRVKAIAVDPTDTTGNTVLLGGAQGGIWRSPDAGATWTEVGDTNPSLAMGSIAFAPSQPSTVYAGTGEQASIGFDSYYGAGVLKSTNGGQTWAQTCTTPSSTCPFVGPFNNTLKFGFFNDGGARISYLAVNPQNPNLVLVGAQIRSSASETAGGIYCSSDAGATWTALLSGQAGSFVGFANATVAYVALGRPFGTSAAGANPNGIYKSTNASANCSAMTFSPVTSPVAAGQSMGRIDLGIAPSDATGNTVYASIADGSNGSATNLGVWVTTNGGTSWTKTGAPDICQQQCWYDNVIKVDPSNSNIVFLGGSAVTSQTSFEWVMRSTNGTAGGTFSPAIPSVQGSGLPHVDQHAMAFVKATSGTFAGKVRMYLGNDGGVWRTDDAEATTVTWTNINNPNLTLTQFYPSLSFNLSNPGVAFGGAQDNGSQIYQGSLNWTDDGQCGDGWQTAVDFQVPTTVYVACQGVSLAVSTTGGTNPNSYNPAGNGINIADNVNFIAPVTADPSTVGRVYFATDKVYQSNDSGSSFTALSGILPTGTGAVLTSLGVAPTNAGVVYAGADDGEVFVATNVAAGFATFSPVAGQSQLPPRNVNAIVADPADNTGKTAYAVFSGFAFGSDTKGHIFKTTDAGATWADVSCSVTNCITPAMTDLPNIPVNDLVVDPDVPGTLYAATDLGAFQGTCTGSVCTWNTLGTSLPNVAVLSLRLHEPSRTLFAATHGRGAWTLSLTNFIFVGPHISSLTPTSTTAPGNNVSIQVNGSSLTGGQVQWDGAATNVTTTPVSDTQLNASLANSLVASSGTHKITVAVGAQTSNALTFTVLGAAPTISSVNPTQANVNSLDTPITVTGTNFTSGSKVIWNPLFNGTGGSIQLATTFTDSTHLSATITAPLMANFGSTNDIGVLNPPPGGGLTVPPPTLPTFKVVAPAPPNDNFASAISITGNSFSDTKDSSAATNETTDPTPTCASSSQTLGKSNSIWYKFAAPASGNVLLDTNGSNYDTVLSVWTGSAGSLAAVPNGCNDDIQPGVVTTSQVSFNATGGTTYSIMVSSFGPPQVNPVALGGKSVLNFQFVPPPFTLTPQAPTSVTVTAGSAATYTIAVAPTGSFTGTVNLSCSLPATATTCTVNPNSVNLGASQNVTVTVSTTKRGALPPVRLPRPRGPIGRTAPVVLVALLVIFVAARSARTRWLRLAFSLPLVALLMLLIAGCRGLTGGGGTPAGTYTVTVTGTSGSSSSSTTVTLVVN